MSASAADAPAGSAGGTSSEATSARSSAGRSGLLLGLFFASGFAALVYQVLWVREIGLLVGRASGSQPTHRSARAAASR